MAESCISSEHIQKLGHQIQEIRERGLVNLISKLERGVPFDNELARTQELLQKLFDWFLWDPCNYEEVVLGLLEHILNSASGQLLVKHNGSDTIADKLNQIRSFSNPSLHDQIDKILNRLNASPKLRPQISIPALEIPLSYRTGQSDFTQQPTPSTVYYEPSSTRESSNSSKPSSSCSSNKPFNLIFPRQELVESDLNVLKSFEHVLANPPNSSSLLQSCQFFRDVLIHDFPAEIFLQRPRIVNTLYDLLLNCTSNTLRVAVLNCYRDFIKTLKIRVNHYLDPYLFNHKTVKSSINNSISSSPNTDDFLNELIIDLPDNSRISVVQFSFKTVILMLKLLYFNNTDRTPRRIKQNVYNLDLIILEDIIDLLQLVLHKNVWCSANQSDLLEDVVDVLTIYGEALQYYRISENLKTILHQNLTLKYPEKLNLTAFRLQAITNDSDLNLRVVHIILIYNCTNFLIKFVSLSRSDLILPQCLKQALEETLIDSDLARLYPKIYEIILEFVESFSGGIESTALKKYKLAKGICEGLQAIDEFLKIQPTKLSYCVELIKKALPAINIHKHDEVVKKYVEQCASKLSLHKSDELLKDSEEITLKLLAHKNKEIQLSMYKLCHRRVIGAIGPKLNLTGSGMPGAQILFLVRPKILIEIALFGVTNDCEDIRRYSEDILIHLVKCKILVTEEIWNRILEAIISSFPIILCHASRKSVIGRNLIDMLDPDSGPTYSIPTIEVLKSNIILLYSKEVQVREEAFSRLSWLVASQKNSKNLLPRLNNLHDKALYNVLKVERPQDVNRAKSNQHFYQPSSLIQVLELLKSPNVEPVILRSALTQICVMTEDPLLHSTFLEQGGVDLALKIMEYSLTEEMFDYYPDSLIPIIGILKNLCLFIPTLRQELSINKDIYYWILRAVFMFFTESYLQTDASCLLFLLLFSDFILGSPSMGDMSVPLFLSQKLELPFACNYYWTNSPYTEEDSKELLLSDPWCLRSIQIQINSNLLGGFDNLLEKTEIDYENFVIDDYLKLKKYDLQSLRATSVNFCIRKYLYDIQNGTSHETVMMSIYQLTIYLHLFKISQVIEDNQDIKKLPWEDTFSNFLKILPSGEEDISLLNNVINFLKLLAPFHKLEKEFWLQRVFGTKENALLDLLDVSRSDDTVYKYLLHDLLDLLVLMLNLEEQQHFLSKSYNLHKAWRHIAKLIIENLRHYQKQPFYNLSKLDSILSCLCHFTGSLGWCVDDYQIKMVTNCISELVITFHQSKGSKASVSLMGLSITRNALLILNHLVAEMQFIPIKNWELIFLELDLDWTKGFYAFWCSRDVIIRTASVQLLAGLAHSPRLAIEIVNGLKNGQNGLWESTLSLLIDSEEASSVRENCALLLASLTRHTDNNGLHKSIKPDTDLLELIDFYQIFKNLHNFINSLNIQDKVARNYFDTKQLATPSLIKNLVIFLSNVSSFEFAEISSRLHEAGLIKMLFKCICNPILEITNKRRLLIYCDILEMDSAICAYLGQLAKNSGTCLGTIVNTTDCLNALVLLLDQQIYYTHLPELLSSRNQLWSEIFKLIAVMTIHDDISNEMVFETLSDTGGSKFLETLCESIKNLNCSDLQTFALSALAFILRKKSPKIENLLDTVRIAKVEVASSKSENNEENNYNKMNILEIAYFGKLENSPQLKTGDNFGGTEVCRILMYLYDLTNTKTGKGLTTKKSLVISSLTELLKVSKKANQFAKESGLLVTIIKQLREFYIKFGLESNDCLRQIYDKKKICPLLNDLNELIGLVTNFMFGVEEIKVQAATVGLSDYIHKLWIWFTTQKPHLVDVLRLLVTLTANCDVACQSLLLTSSTPGSGPRKVPSNYSLLHEILNLINKELDQISKTHDLEVLAMSYNILKNCCESVECRNVFLKNTSYQNIVRLHPSITKKQKTWESAQLLWLDFMKVFTFYPEGQSVAKMKDVLDIVMTISVSTKSTNRFAALLVLRNFTFFQSNRPRLLSLGEFLNILQSKLESGNKDEILVTVSMIWALAANNQKAKHILKTASIDNLLKEATKHLVLRSECLEEEEVEEINYVINIINE